MKQIKKSLKRFFTPFLATLIVGVALFLAPTSAQANPVATPTVEESFVTSAMGASGENYRKLAIWNLRISNETLVDLENLQFTLHAKDSPVIFFSGTPALDTWSSDAFSINTLTSEDVYTIELRVNEIITPTSGTTHYDFDVSYTYDGQLEVPNCSSETLVDCINFTYDFDGPAISQELLPINYVDTSCNTDGTHISPTINTPADTEEVTYETSGVVSAGETVLVTATATDGNRLDFTEDSGWARVSDTTATFEIIFSNPDCQIQTILELPTITEAQCLISGEIVNPSLEFPTLEGVTFEIISGSMTPGSTITIRATAHAGYYVSAQDESVWEMGIGNAYATTTLTFEDIVCLTPVTLEDPFVEQSKLIDNIPTLPLLTLPETEGISYEIISGEVVAGGSVTLRATLLASHKLNLEPDSLWMLSDDMTYATLIIDFDEAPMPDNTDNTGDGDEDKGADGDNQNNGNINTDNNGQNNGNSSGSQTQTTNSSQTTVTHVDVPTNAQTQNQKTYKTASINNVAIIIALSFIILATLALYLTRRKMHA